jgi:hypothetical protein
VRSLTKAESFSHGVGERPGVAVRGVSVAVAVAGAAGEFVGRYVWLGRGVALAGVKRAEAVAVSSADAVWR